MVCSLVMTILYGLYMFLIIKFCFYCGLVFYFEMEDDVIWKAGLVDYVFEFSTAAARHGVRVYVYIFSMQFHIKCIIHTFPAIV